MFCDEQFTTNIFDNVVVSAYLRLSEDIVSDGSFCWDYFLRFENNSDFEVILLSKKLSVIDTKGQVTSVNYPGFKGRCPQIIPGDDFEDDGYVTAKSSALLKGSCTVKIGNEIKNIDLPVMSLIANDNEKRVLN